MEENQFTEKQYLGLNKMSFFKRMVLSIFCFLAYYWSENHDKSGDLFFFLGISILVISALLVFVLHFETRITKDAIILDGLWTSRKVKIDVNSLQSAEIVKYSRFFLNRSVYNLHFKGSIRFFTRGKDAVKLTDKDGQVYLIGSQKVEELERIIKNKLNNK
tara:strand:- start:365 stop:847 length:483 start_codon:yes stop_codon:yes gene_type:complete